MRKLTPNWDELAKILVYKLDDVADDINYKIDLGEDAVSAVHDALDDLKLFIGAIEDDPGQFTIQDVS